MELSRIKSYKKLKEIFMKVIIPTLFFVIFYPTYSHLFGRFSARDSYYSHGYIVPFVCLYFVWQKRKRLKEIDFKSEIIGIFVLSAGLLLHLVSLSLRINFGSYFAIPISIFGIVLYLYGRKALKEVIFPIVFLVFMLPLPKVVIIAISFKMKLLAAQGAIFIAESLSMKAQRVGSIIYYPGGQLLVGDPCSGLRSLISFLALGAVFTQLTGAKLWRKIILFFTTIPIALLSNLSRIFFLFTVSYIYGEKAAQGVVHDFSGFMVFVLGFLLLILASKLLKCSLVRDN